MITTAWEYFYNAPGEAWGWFGSLNREEWLVTLAFVSALGFMSLMGLRSSRL